MLQPLFGPQLVRVAHDIVMLIRHDGAHVGRTV